MIKRFWLSIFCISIFFPAWSQNKISSKSLEGSWVWYDTWSDDEMLNQLMEPISLVFKFSGDSTFSQEIYTLNQFIGEYPGAFKISEQGRKLTLLNSDGSSLQYKVESFDGDNLMLAELSTEGKVSLYYTFKKKSTLTFCSATEMQQGREMLSPDGKYFFFGNNAHDTVFVFEQDTLYSYFSYRSGEKIAIMTAQGDSVYTSPEFFTEMPVSLCGVIERNFITRIDTGEPMGFWRAGGDCRGALVAALARAFSP